MAHFTAAHLTPLTSASLTRTTIPIFLAPAFQPSCRMFSSTPSQSARKPTRKGTRDSNPRRAISPIRQTGHTHKLAVDTLYGSLPNPRPRRAHQAMVANMYEEESKTHGLNGFFPHGTSIRVPEEEQENGVAWPYEALAMKDFADLHGLYWKCVLDINAAKTSRLEFKRVSPGYGLSELSDRVEKLQSTMNRIRKVLLDRQTAFEELQLMRRTGKSVAELGSRVGYTAEDIDDMAPR